MTTQKQTSKQYFRSIKILFFGLLIGQIAFALITLFLNLGLMFLPDDSLRDIFIYVVPIFVVNGFVTGHLIYKNRIKKIKQYNGLISKMSEYKSALIIRLAMLEGASLFAIVVYLISGDLIFISMSGLIILYFILLNPTVDKITMELGLSPEEVSRIENPSEIIAEFESNS